MSETFTGNIRILDDDSNRVIDIYVNQPTVSIGRGERSGSLHVNGSGERTFEFDGDQATLHLGARHRAGKLQLRDNDGRYGITADAGTGTINVGNNGSNGGQIYLTKDSGHRTISLLGSKADIVLGGNQLNGTLHVLNSEGEATCQIIGRHGNLILGAEGADGDIFVKDRTGENTIHINGESGEVRLLNADCAEDFEVADDVDVEAGEVMVIDDDGILRPACEAYDRRVAGIISGAGDTRPGIVLGRDSSLKNRWPIALSGRVNCKVDADFGAIRVGDLLTTATTIGHAMKADDPTRGFGAVIGKALRPLSAGRAMIPVLVALQ